MLINATALYVINRVDEPSGASVGMWQGVHCAPIEWAEIFRAGRHVSKACCASTVGDVHDRACDTPEARAEWAPRSAR